MTKLDVLVLIFLVTYLLRRYISQSEAWQIIVTLPTPPSFSHGPPILLLEQSSANDLNTALGPLRNSDLDEVKVMEMRCG